MGYNGNIKTGTYPHHRALGWRDDMAGDKPILRVEFEIDGERIEWTCWLGDNDMTNDKGQPSANAKGLQALGVTTDDLREWARGGALQGLDRNEVSLVVEFDKGGWPKVKYVNAPGAGMREGKPLDRGQRVSVAQRMAQTLVALEKSTAVPAHMAPRPPAAQAQGFYQPPSRGEIYPTVRPAGGTPPGSDDDIPF